MTRSTVLRWVWFVVCAALAVAAGCAAPLQVTWHVQGGGWSRSGTLELSLRSIATTEGARVVLEADEAWPLPSEWAYREASGLPLPEASPAPGPEPEPSTTPAGPPRRSSPTARGAVDARRRTARGTDAPAVRLVRGEVAPAQDPRPLEATSPHPASAPASARAPTAPAPAAPAPAVIERRAAASERLAMFVAVVALTLGTIAVPFMLSRRRGGERGR